MKNLLDKFVMSAAYIMALVFFLGVFAGLVAYGTDWLFVNKIIDSNTSFFILFALTLAVSAIFIYETVMYFVKGDRATRLNARV